MPSHKGRLFPACLEQSADCGLEEGSQAFTGLMDESALACNIWPSESRPVIRECLVSFGKAVAHQRPASVSSVTICCSAAHKGLSRSLVTFSYKAQFPSTAPPRSVTSVLWWVFLQGPGPVSVGGLFCSEQCVFSHRIAEDYQRLKILKLNPYN